MQENSEVDETPRQRFGFRKRLGEQVLGIDIARVVVFGRAIERGGLLFDAGRRVGGRAAKTERQQRRSGRKLEP